MDGAHSVREKQGLVPDLQLGDSHYELKSTRIDSCSRTNYSAPMVGCVAPDSLPVSPRTKKELSIADLIPDLSLMAEKAAKLDRDTFGVAVGQGPWQRRLEEIGGASSRWPLVSLGRWRDR
jgi:hypothetical protein